MIRVGSKKYTEVDKETDWYRKANIGYEMWEYVYKHYTTHMINQRTRVKSLQKCDIIVNGRRLKIPYITMRDRSKVPWNKDEYPYQMLVHLVSTYLEVWKEMADMILEVFASRDKGFFAQCISHGMNAWHKQEGLIPVNLIKMYGLRCSKMTVNVGRNASSDGLKSHLASKLLMKRTQTTDG